MRTGASAAVSAKWLARKDSTVLAIVGTGSVGQGALATCDAVFPWSEVRVWSRTAGVARPVRRGRAPLYPHLELTGLDRRLERSSRGADVIVTGTHARQWIVDDAWMKPGAHLAALGADLEGEQELDPRHPASGRVSSSTTSASAAPTVRSTSPLREGLITEDDLAGEIGKVICGELEGRRSDDEMTVFDSTGIALQDSATVPLEYERAVAAGVGVEKKMIST